VSFQTTEPSRAKPASAFGVMLNSASTPCAINSGALTEAKLVGVVGRTAVTWKFVKGE
jgi:hypothetical protein